MSKLDNEEILQYLEKQLIELIRIGKYDDAIKLIDAMRIIISVLL